MFLKQLYLKNFRSYTEELVSFKPGVNLIYGDNGQGKTNLLEAIYLLSTGRSFRSNFLHELIQHGADSFTVIGVIEKNGIEHKLSLSYSKQQKSVFHNQTKHPNFSNVLGIFPSVIFSPVDICLINGSPQDRRKFINLHIAQFDPVYIYHLARCAKAVQQRNALIRKKSITAIDIWEREIAKSSFYIFQKRHACCELFNKHIKDQSFSLLKEEDAIHLKYTPHAPFENEEELLSYIKAHREKDFYFGSTTVGPHRDDIFIYFNKKLAKTYASEGQKRTIIALLRSLQHFLLAKECDMPPIFSIDDFAVHLDQNRKDLLKGYILRHQQVFISSPFEEDFSKSNSLFVKDGKIHQY